MTGLLKLVPGLEESKAVPNAQLRVLNPHVSNVLGAELSTASARTAASVVDGNVQQAGSVSSLDTLGRLPAPCLTAAPSGTAKALGDVLTFKRRSHPWSTFAVASGQSDDAITYSLLDGISK